MLLAVGQLVLKVIQVAVVKKPFPLEEVDEHQAVQQYGGVPAALPSSGMPSISSMKATCSSWNSLVELLGDPLDVEGLADAGDFDDADVPLFIELADVEDHLAELAEEQVARLALDSSKWSRRVGLAVSPLDPIPEALGPLALRRGRYSMFSWCCFAISL